MLPQREIWRENQNRALFSAQTETEHTDTQGYCRPSYLLWSNNKPYAPGPWSQRSTRAGRLWLTADLLLPPHLIVEVVKLLEEVVDLAALVVSLCGGEHTHLGLLGQVLADVGYWKHDLLHGAIMTHNLTNTFMVNPSRRISFSTSLSLIHLIN